MAAAPSLVAPSTAQRKGLPTNAARTRRRAPGQENCRGDTAASSVKRPRRTETMGEPRDETWYLETKKRIREAFQLFDKDRKGCVVQEEVATIMRYLGAYPAGASSGQRDIGT